MKLQPRLAPIKEKSIYVICLKMDFKSPLNIPSFNISKEEKVPPKATATAQILIEHPRSIMVLKGGRLLINADRPAKRQAPIITPKEIKRLCNILPIKGSKKTTQIQTKCFCYIYIQFLFNMNVIFFNSNYLLNLTNI